MKFNPFDGMQAGDWARVEAVAARARQANARTVCFMRDFMGGVYIAAG